MIIEGGEIVEFQVFLMVFNFIVSGMCLGGYVHGGGNTLLFLSIANLICGFLQFSYIEF